MAVKNIVFKANELNDLVSDKKACVKKISNCSRKLSLMPIHLADLKSSIRECLDSEVTTYDEGLGGIILSFKNVKVETLSKDDPGNFMIPVNYTADIYIFKPKIGSVLKGVVSKKSNDHIGCLVHRLFNVSIFRPRETPFEEWEASTYEIGDQVTFKIDFMDLGSRLPFIKGVLIEDG